MTTSAAKAGRRADIVERLEAEIEMLRARNAEHEARYDALEAMEEYRRRENERLRAALGKIADPLTMDVQGVGFGRALAMLTEARNIAMAALAVEQSVPKQEG